MQQPSTATLVPCREESVDFDNTQNVFIEGENMEVLKVLQRSYFRKVKMIYIDPPYNTGSDSFIYPDKFSESKEEYLRRVGDKNEEGYMTRDGMFRKNAKEKWAISQQLAEHDDATFFILQKAYYVKME